MNRIILIGNGFDLAHKIKTSYSDFIDDYWENTIDQFNKRESDTFKNSEISITNIPTNEFQILNTLNFNEFHGEIETIRGNFGVENLLFYKISRLNEEKNWVNIENFYYKELKKNLSSQSEEEVTKLNLDLLGIAKLLEKYLFKKENEFKLNTENQINQSFIKQLGLKIYADFNFRDFNESAINRQVEKESYRLDNYENVFELHNNNKIKALIDRIGREYSKKKIRELLISPEAKNYFDLEPTNILFLNFNYTSTEKHYSNHSLFRDNIDPEKLAIHIHGSINPEDKNKIIFGYGDELDENYKLIENKNENKYLENIKSIKYSETDNYKKLLEYLNSDDFQIFILGHSCGLSDRTLLSTLFEHENCVSIKPYYHQIDENTDNYSDIIRNISRNFKDKSIMRDKVVNKTYCEPINMRVAPRL
jgi:hypothetical protein